MLLILRLWVTEDQIEIPGGQITGPDLNMNYKEFIVNLTVNDFDKVCSFGDFFFLIKSLYFA